MARKLYIFTPTGKVRNTSAGSVKWVGGFSTNYSYLGDYEARLLGVGNHLTIKKLPPWLHAPTSGAKFLKGGASRHDRDFRGWG